MATLADLEKRVTKIEKHLLALYKWNLALAKLLQKVDIDCVVRVTGCKQVIPPKGGGVPANPPQWP